MRTSRILLVSLLVAVFLFSSVVSAFAMEFYHHFYVPYSGRLRCWRGTLAAAWRPGPHQGLWGFAWADASSYSNMHYPDGPWPISKIQTYVRVEAPNGNRVSHYNYGYNTSHVRDWTPNIDTQWGYCDILSTHRFWKYSHNIYYYNRLNAKMFTPW